MCRFSQIYHKSSQIQQDSKRFRISFGQYLNEIFNNYSLATEIKKQLGLNIQIYSNPNAHYTYNISALIDQANINDVLDIVTIAHNLLKDEKSHNYYSTDKIYQVDFINFINKRFAEENLCYKIDNEGIVCYSPDEEFHRTKNEALKCLSNPRYQAVAHEFNLAYQMLNLRPPNTKSAIKAIFESLEIICKLLILKTEKRMSLGGDLIAKELKPLLENYYKNNQTAKEAISLLMQSFTNWTKAMHLYRHGQRTEKPNEPPLELATFAISSGASFLRLLTQIDTSINNVLKQTHQNYV